MRHALLAIFAAMLMLAPTAQALTPKQQIAALKRQNATLRVQLSTAQALAAIRLNASRALKLELADMTTARDNALAGLPAAIKAVPIDQWVALVFAPAKEARLGTGCGDSYYNSDGYSSYTFNLGRFCD